MRRAVGEQREPVRGARCVGDGARDAPETQRGRRAPRRAARGRSGRRTAPPVRSAATTSTGPTPLALALARTNAERRGLTVDEGHRARRGAPRRAPEGRGRSRARPHGRDRAAPRRRARARRSTDAPSTAAPAHRRRRAARAGRRSARGRPPARARRAPRPTSTLRESGVESGEMPALSIVSHRDWCYGRAQSTPAGRSRWRRWSRRRADPRSPTGAVNGAVAARRPRAPSVSRRHFARCDCRGARRRARGLRRKRAQSEAAEAGAAAATTARHRRPPPSPTR